MGYVLAGLLVVLIVGTAVTLGVRASRKRRQDQAITATDRDSPLGDTPEHSEASS
jgi:hypothetical protein